MRHAKTRAILVFLIYAGLALALLGAKMFAPDELFFQAVRDPNPWFISYPWRNFVRLCFAAGEFPLWNPYNALGSPFLANYQEAIFSPFRWPFYFLPFRPTIVPLIVSELTLAGFGAYLFARRLKLSGLSAFACGAGYMLSGYLVQYLNNQHLPLELLLPYGLLVMDRLAERQSRSNFFLAALVFALMLLAGQPTTALLDLGLCFFYFIFKGASLKKRFRPTVVLAGAFGLALLISSLQILPFLELIPQGWTFHPVGYAAQFLKLRTSSSLFSPLIYFDHRHRDSVQQLFPWLGAAISLLALISIFNLRKLRNEAVFFAAVALAGLGVVYGLPGFRLLTALPGLNRLGWFRYLQPIITLSVMVLAGMGCELLKGSHRVLRGILILAVCLEPMVWHRLVDRPMFWINMEKVDLSRFRKLQEENPGARFAAAPEVWIPNLMLMVPLYDLGLNESFTPKRYVELVKFLNQSRSEDEFLTDFFAYHSLRLKESAFNSPVSKILAAKFFLRKSAPKEFLPWETEEGFWIPGHDGLTPHYTHTALYGDPVYVLPIPAPLPRIFFAERTERRQGDPAQLPKLLEQTDLQQEAVLEDEAPAKHLRKGEIIRSDYRPSGISIAYRSGGKAFMVLSEQYFPGWRAYWYPAGSGWGAKRELRIYQTDYLLRGVFVPRGQHRLELFYQPWGFRVGLWASLASLAAALMAAGFSAGRPRPGPARSAS